MTLLRVYAKEIGLTDEDLDKLENCDLKIRFIDDFLFMEEYNFKYCNVSNTALMKARDKFFKMYTKNLEVLSVFKKLNHSSFYLPLGIEKFNHFLDGGLPLNKVTELRGDCKSGKTLFCLNLALDLLLNTHKVLYIDTDYGLCSNLMVDLIQEKIKDKDLVMNLMNEFDVCFLNNYKELVYKLDRLYLTQLNGKTNYDFLIIDSIVSLIGAECLSSKRKDSLDEVNEKLSTFINCIIKLLESSITILTVNSSSSTLPKLWSNRCDLVLSIRKEEYDHKSLFSLKIKKSFNSTGVSSYKLLNGSGYSDDSSSNCLNDCSFSTINNVSNLNGSMDLSNLDSSINNIINYHHHHNDSEINSASNSEFGTDCPLNITINNLSDINSTITTLDTNLIQNQTTNATMNRSIETNQIAYNLPTLTFSLLDNGSINVNDLNILDD